MKYGWTKIALSETMSPTRPLNRLREGTMVEPTELTIHSTEDSDEVAGSLEAGLSRPTPRMVLLYHAELSRVGATTAPDLFAGGRRVALGRNNPSFISPRPGESARPLEDRRISRLHAEVRWLEAVGVFEVEPSLQARKPLSRVIFDPQGPRLEPITETARLPPGSLLAVGKRALLLLEQRAWRSPSDDRMEMIGETERVWTLRREIDSVARFERSVLILGETGAGKELVARAIHASSPRVSEPFVAVNCAALPEHLVESMLFGHKKGAFTGAEQDRPGLFQEADGGVLFLDELGELPMRLQAKLLRVAQDGLLTPIGGHRSLPVDVRLIAATNRDPQHEIRAGRLREDLYYRIAAHTIMAPSLNERIWDVPLLLLHALEQTRQSHPELGWIWQPPSAHKAPIPMSFILTLLAHPWNGNVRELLNVAEQTARLNLEPGPFTAPPGLERPAPGEPEAHAAAPLMTPVPVPAPQLDAGLLKRSARHFGIARSTLEVLLQTHPIEPPAAGEPFERSIERLREHLATSMHRMLAQVGYNQVQLSDELGLSRSTVIKLIRILDLDRPQDFSVEALTAAAEQASGDVEAMADLLCVSSRALKLHLTRNNLDHLLE